MNVKESRHHDLLELQRKVTERNNQPWLGREITVFAEAVSTKKGTGNTSLPDRQAGCLSPFLIGRTDQDKKVVFPGEGNIVGQFVKTKLTNLRHETFLGELVNA